MLYLALSLFIFGYNVLAALGNPLSPSQQHSRTSLLRRSSNSSSIYQTRFENVTWDNDNWQLTTSNLDQGHFQSRMTVANGYHGINVAALGPFFEVDLDGDINGWPLFDRRQTFATISGFWDSQPTTNGSNFPWLYQYGWDSVISGIPHWAGIVIDLGGDDVLDASTNASSISNFNSTLDMKQGLMNWAFTWTTANHGSYDITYQMFAHKVQINQGFVKLEITPNKDSNLTVVNVINGDSALRTNTSGKGTEGSLVYSAVSPWGVENVKAYVYTAMSVSQASIVANHSSWNASYIGGNASSIATALDISLVSGQTASIIKYAGIASSDASEDAQSQARDAITAAIATGYQDSLGTHVEEWAALFPRTSVDDFTFPENGSLPGDPYVIEAAVTAVTNPYHILQNLISKNATIAVNNTSINNNSISVGGLGSDSYAGQIFWDADVWVHPGIAAAFPYASSGITNYRERLLPQAHANAQTNYQSSKNQTSFSSEAAIYAWTSGRYGNCTATGPCWDYEYHLNGDIVLALMNQWLSSGDAQFHEDVFYPITNSIATMYSEVMEPNGSYWQLTNMTDPDEYANQVDNGGFTMPLMAETLRIANDLRNSFNETPNATWNTQAQNVLIGRDVDANIVLEYTGPTPMNGSIEVKQADVVLISYPLSYFNENYTTANALSDLDYYANKQSPDGPGMTYAIFSIVANEVSPSGCSAYTYQQYSYQPYARAPWFQLSEQLIDNAAENGGTHPAYPFLTGHGGANQVVLYGYLGLRYVNDGHLHLDPAPPRQITHIRYRTFYWQGWPISAVSNETHTTISRDMPFNPTSGVTPNDTFTTNPIPVLVGPSASPEEQTLYQLSPNGTVVVVNRQYWLNQTVPNNIAQCQSVTTSNSDFIPGQFPIGAVDGASSTRWQPKFANVTSSITVSLPVGHQVTSLEFDWSSQPPYNYSVTFHNETSVTSSSAVVVAFDNDVAVSRPYNATEALEVIAIAENITIVPLAGSSYNGPAVFTAQFATLSIWGNRMNGTLTAQNMTGDGATVAEFSIVVAGNSTQSGGYGIPNVKARRSPVHERQSEYHSRMLNRRTRLEDGRMQQQ